MKKIFLLLIFFIITSLNGAHAASPTPSADQVQKQIDQLKDRIASRVAQLNLVEKRGIIGNVTDVTDTQITLSDVNGNTRFVDVDELTKFNGPKSTQSFGISDVKKNQTLGVLGLYNKQSRRLLARSVDVIVVPKMIQGFVASVDSENFIINIVTDKNEQLQVEVETTTKTLSYDRSKKDVVRSGFSKIKGQQSIFVVGFTDKTIKNKINADRIIILPDILKGPTIPVEQPIVPSTGSGKKLTPIVK